VLPPSPRRIGTLALVAALPLALAACGATGDTSTVAASEATTSSAAGTPAASHASETPAASAATTTVAATTKGSNQSDLQFRASMLAAAFTSGDFGSVWDIACPGVRKGASRDAYAKSLAGAPRTGLSKPTVLDTKVEGSDAASELAAPGIATDDQKFVRFTVTPGTANPNPTMTARFVHSSQGWQYCGMAPDA
jgi:hypothetical protein